MASTNSETFSNVATKVCIDKIETNKNSASHALTDCDQESGRNLVAGYLWGEEEVIAHIDSVDDSSPKNNLVFFLSGQNYRVGDTLVEDVSTASGRSTWDFRAEVGCAYDIDSNIKVKDKISDVLADIDDIIAGNYLDDDVMKLLAENHHVSDVILKDEADPEMCVDYKLMNLAYSPAGSEPGCTDNSAASAGDSSYYDETLDFIKGTIAELSLVDDLMTSSSCHVTISFGSTDVDSSASNQNSTSACIASDIEAERLVSKPSADRNVASDGTSLAPAAEASNCICLEISETKAKTLPSGSSTAVCAVNAGSESMESATVTINPSLSTDHLNQAYKPLVMQPEPASGTVPDEAAEVYFICSNKPYSGNDTSNSIPVAAPPPPPLMRITTTSLTPEETEFMLTAAKRWNWTLTTFATNVTHVIVKPIGNKNRAAQRTLKFIMGVAAGAWVVSYQWVVDCLARDKLLPEIFYEMSCCAHDDKWVNNCAPLRSRLSPSRLLDGWHITLEGRELASQASIKTLITLAGACVEKGLCTCSRAKVVTIVDIKLTDNILGQCEASVQAQRAVVIDWLFDCLTEYKILDTTPYLLKTLQKQQRQREKFDAQTRHCNDTRRNKKKLKKYSLRARPASREQATQITAAEVIPGIVDNVPEVERRTGSHSNKNHTESRSRHTTANLHRATCSSTKTIRQQCDNVKLHNPGQHDDENNEIITLEPNTKRPRSARNNTVQASGERQQRTARVEYELQRTQLRQVLMKEQRLQHNKNQQKQPCKPIMNSKSKRRAVKLKNDINQQVLVAQKGSLEMQKAPVVVQQPTNKSEKHVRFDIDKLNNKKDKKQTKHLIEQQKASEGGKVDSSRNTLRQQNGLGKTKHYCKFCGEKTNAICRHLQEFHADESQIICLLKLKKGTKKRQRQLHEILEEGNKLHRYQNNSKSSYSKSHPKEGVTVPTLQETVTVKVWSKDLERCTFCRRCYMPRDLPTHQERCFLKPKDPTAVTEQRPSTVVPLAVSAGASAALLTLLESSDKDETLKTYLQDDLVAKFGSLLCAKHCSRRPHREPLVRMKILELGRLLNCLQQANNLSLAEFIHPHKFLDVFRAVGQLGGYDEATGTYKNKALTLKLCHSLKICASIIQSNATLSGDERSEIEASEFVRMCERQWGYGGEVPVEPSNIIFGNQQRETLMLVPLMEDVKTFKVFVDKHVERCLETLQDDTRSGRNNDGFSSAFCDLSQLALCQTVLFNLNRFDCERSFLRHLLLKEYLTERSRTLTELKSLSNIEQLLSAMICTIETRSNDNEDKALLPVQLNSKLKSTIDCLLTQRGVAGVSNDNVYLFTKPGSDKSYRIGRCLAWWAERCFGDAQSQFATAMKRKGLHKHVTTMWQVLSLTPDELNLLAVSLVESNSLPNGALHALSEGDKAARVVRLCTAINKGQLTQFNSIRLDEIPVDNVELSEDEGVEFDKPPLLNSKVQENYSGSSFQGVPESAMPVVLGTCRLVHIKQEPMDATAAASNEPCLKRRPKDPPGSCMLKRKTSKQTEKDKEKRSKKRKLGYQHDSEYLPKKKQKQHFTPDKVNIDAKQTANQPEPEHHSGRCKQTLKPAISRFVEGHKTTKIQATEATNSKKSSGTNTKVLLTEEQQAAILECFGSELCNVASRNGVSKLQIEEVQSRAPALHSLSWRDIRHFLQHYSGSIRKFGHNLTKLHH